MALIKGTNSYVTVEEADSYFETRLDAAAWDVADSGSKTKSLVTATSMLDGLVWTGVAVSDLQSLAFPRVGEYFDPRVGGVVVLPATTPARITKATFELSYHLLNNDGLLDDTGEVTSLSIGPLNLNAIKSASSIPSVVRNLINPLLVNGGAKSWWRSN